MWESSLVASAPLGPVVPPEMIGATPAATQEELSAWVICSIAVRPSWLASTRSVKFELN